MLERFHLCEHFHWTPQQLDEVDTQEVRDFLEVLQAKGRIAEREQRAAEAKARR